MLTKDESIWKAIPVKKLMALLEQVPSDAIIGVSRVDDLLVLSLNEEYLGYIDISSEEYEPID